MHEADQLEMNRQLAMTEPVSDDGPKYATSNFRTLNMLDEEITLLADAIEYYVDHMGEKVTDKETVQSWLDLYEYIADRDPTRGEERTAAKLDGYAADSKVHQLSKNNGVPF